MLELTDDEIMELVATFFILKMEAEKYVKKSPNMAGPHESFDRCTRFFNKFSDEMNRRMPQINKNIETAMMLDQADDLANKGDKK